MTDTGTDVSLICAVDEYSHFFSLVALHETALEQGAIVRIPERHD